MEILTSLKTHKFFCEKCNTGTNNKKDFNKHLMTLKHKNEGVLKHKTIKPEIHSKKETAYNCVLCKKEYKSRVGLWKHKKVCKENKSDENTDNINQLLYSMLELIDNQNKLIIKLTNNSPSEN